MAVSDLLNTLLLLAVPLTPLLLAFPALHSRLPKAQFFALLPAVIVVLIPAAFSAELPWLIFGSEMMLNSFNRLLLAVSIIAWAIALFRFSSQADSEHRLMPFLLLVMAGNFGAIVAADLLLFFGFTTLMGYAFYAVLVTSAGPVQPVARIYLWLMIVADLLLFEVLLLLAVDNTNLDFSSANSTMALSPLVGLNLWLVLVGFMLKAGIWPFHFWLLSTYRYTKPALTLLLTVAPVSVALLGLLRWLPLGEISLPMHGLIIQGVGVSAMLYAFISMRRKAGMKMRPSAHGVTFMTGLFLTGIGAGLADAASWNRYAAWGYYYVAAPGFVVLILVWLTGRKPLQDNEVKQIRQPHDLTLRLDSFAGLQATRVGRICFCALSEWRTRWQAVVKRLRSSHYVGLNIMDVGETRLSNWSMAITLLLLLGLVMVFVSGYSQSG